MIKASIIASLSRDIERKKEENPFFLNGDALAPGTLKKQQPQQHQQPCIPPCHPTEKE